MADSAAESKKRREGKEGALSIVKMENNAANGSERPGRQHYIWPWFVLAAVLLAVVLSILWMRHEVKRIERSRDSNASPPELQK